MPLILLLFQVAVGLAVYPRNKLNDALACIKNNAALSLTNRNSTSGSGDDDHRTIRVSGMSMGLETRNVIERELQAKYVFHRVRLDIIGCACVKLNFNSVLYNFSIQLGMMYLKQFKRQTLWNVIQQQIPAVILVPSS